MTEHWSNHVAIVVDGILKQPNDTAVIIPGLMLYRSLVKDHKVSLILDSAAKEKVQYWLLMNGLTDHVGEIYWEVTDSDDPQERRLEQIARLRRNGPLSCVFESDMEVAGKLLEAGVSTFLFIHPQYAHPEFRPGHSTSEPTPWNDLMSKVVRQKEARATDTRLKDIF